MIKFINVSKTYEDSDTHALNDISFDIDDGEFVFIVGPSGAGKSTLLKLIMREQIPTKGDILIDDQTINKLKRRQVPYLRRKMGMVYQDFRLIEKMNVFDNVAFAMRVIGAKSSEIKERVTHILKLVGLEHKMYVRPSQLSGGEQQRVSLARAIANKPKVLIADEPTANVDADMSNEIMKILKKINKLGTTVLVVTHDKELVNRFGGRIMEIEKGRVIFDSGMAEKKEDESAEDIGSDTLIENTENTSETEAEPALEIIESTVSTEKQEEPNAEDENNSVEESNATEVAPELDANKYDDLIQEIKSEQMENQLDDNAGKDTNREVFI